MSEQLERLRTLLELLERIPEDLAILMEMAEHDQEIRRQLAELAVKIMQIPYRIQVEMAKQLWQVMNR